MELAKQKVHASVYMGASCNVTMLMLWWLLFLTSCWLSACQVSLPGRMTIVTVSLDREDHHSLLLSNKQDHADLHGYDLIVIEELLTEDASNVSMADPDTRRAAAMFTKPLAILNVLSTGLYEWVWWLDTNNGKVLEDGQVNATAQHQWRVAGRCCVFW